MSSAPSKKNLLVLASTYPRWLGDHEPGFVHELSKRLTSSFNVFVICPHSAESKEYETLEGVSVFRYRYAPQKLESLVNDGGIVTNLKNSPWKLLLLPFFFIAQLLLIRKIIRSESIDIVHAHWLIPQGLALALLSKVMKVPPFLVTSHGADLFALKGRFFNSLKLLVAKRASHLSVVSSVMKDELIKLGVTTSKITVLPMGIDLQTFNINRDIIRSKNEILFVGRLVEKKGLSYLINAMPEIRKKIPHAYLTIVGFGPEEANLKALVNRLHLEKYIAFRGAVTQKKLAQYYQRAALFVAPFIEANSGDQEGLGLVVVEALACGCPIVVSDLPACKDVIEGISSVYTYPSRDSTKLALTIIKTLSDLKAHTSRNGEVKKRIHQFGWQNISLQYSEILKKMER